MYILFSLFIDFTRPPLDHGLRVVPVELGRHYLDADSGQTLITLEDFIRTYIYAHGDAHGDGYLAQHDLFSQIEQLRTDVRVPDYCAFLPSGEDSDGEVLTQMWFGPVGTFSPLHHDPYHNLLAQVVGENI